ncbi:MAG: class I SAM-dependent methyltransferase [Armatimonadetes bacterium]|nr:class I SAM-dependent methyltransferase [Armatimonadota bacterium]
MYSLEDRYWWFVGRRTLALGLLKRYQTSPKLILDVGAGTGVVSKAIAEQCPTVSLDFSPEALKFAAKRGLAKCLLADASRIPLVGSTFSAAVGLDIFEHVEHDSAALAEAFRTLEPGGVLVLSVPAFRSLWGPHDIALHHFRRYRRSEVQERLTRVGFSVERCSHAVFFLFPLVILSRVIEKFRFGPPKASLPLFPEWLNRMLIALQSFEARLIYDRGFNLPWGSSIVAVARKPSIVEEVRSS